MAAGISNFFGGSEGTNAENDDACRCGAEDASVEDDGAGISNFFGGSEGTNAENG